MGDAERHAGADEMKPKIYKVAEITRLIKDILEERVGAVWIEGEISNLRCPLSGHYYFTLKDENAQIAAVMFKGRQDCLRFQPANGMLAQVFGLISVYEKSGQHQVIVERMLPGGKGSLQAAFEALKKKLLEEGLFDAARKKPIPLLPRHIGVVTSPTGAAICDILNILFRRFENLHVVLAPARVQGPGAADEIVNAIQELNRLGGLDVIIVARGGGSIEDLWCFNEECVARAVAASAIPIISGVGHETDFTICDFAADLRAPTPSAAAELVTKSKDEIEARLEASSRCLNRALRQHLLNTGNRLAAAAHSRVFLEPGHLARRTRERMGRIEAQIRRAMSDLLRDRAQRLDELEQRLTRAVGQRNHAWEMKIHGLDARLRSMNPLAVLERGYSITSTANGEILARSDRVRIGERIFTRLAAGKLESEVVKKK